MTILLFTDASCKNGYSSYAYKSTLDTKIYIGIKHSMNIAAMEVLAIVKGLSRIGDNESVLVISDFKDAVTIILDYQLGIVRKHWPDTTNFYKVACHRLVGQLKRLNVDAVWVCSKFPSKRHLEVDQMSKIVLQEFLNKGR